MAKPPNITRRRVLGAIAAAPLLWPAMGLGLQGQPASRTIPSNGESLPLVGLGRWVTFNIGNDRAAGDACTEVMRNFFLAGGRLIDSSPIYGFSHEVIGYGLKKLGRQASVFAADKVWISDGTEGRAQIERSRQFWGIPRFDQLKILSAKRVAVTCGEVRERHLAGAASFGI
jgi:diketogulonate reductase-like aldo/keto reductase